MKRIMADELIYHLAEPVSEPWRTVILYHGWGGRVESYRAYAEKLVQQGFRVVVPEIVYQDSRKPVKNPFEMEMVQTYFWKAITESIEEFGTLQKILGVPETEIVLVGSSMGGFIAAGIFACHPRVAGFASVNGSGAFVLTEQIFRERQDRSPMDAETASLLKGFDPMEARPGKGAVLLINGELDRTVPLEGHAAYYRRLTEEFQHQQAESKIFEGAGHRFTGKMEEDVLDWLKELI